MFAYYVRVTSRSMYTNFYENNEIKNEKISIMASKLAYDVPTRPRSGWTVDCVGKRLAAPTAP